ncbi:hypothetical protein EYF80_036415 [Liparis tanakae]|uniref:Uncharacterized protein n=1 Tax=Liparis tanakae TaxID=230148 RepID=A0A4Z2GIJ1_9TELE|nr:hypothetical protein EYF80_036415 [Liparis tanakae]
MSTASGPWDLQPDTRHQPLGKRSTRRQIFIKVGEQLGLAVEVRPAALVGLLQSLRGEEEEHSVVREEERRAGGGGPLIGGPPGRYLDGHVELLLVRRQVVALGEEHLPEGALAQLPLQHDVVPLDVLDDLRAEYDRLSQLCRLN